MVIREATKIFLTISFSNSKCLSFHSSDVRHSLDEHFKSNKMTPDGNGSADGNDDTRHETKLGAIQKNIHQNLASGNPRNLNENVSKNIET